MGAAPEPGENSDEAPVTHLAKKKADRNLIRAGRKRCAFRTEKSQRAQPSDIMLLGQALSESSPARNLILVKFVGGSNSGLPPPHQT